MHPFQKKVLERTLWVDKQRIFWTTLSKNKKFIDEKFKDLDHEKFIHRGNLEQFSSNYIKHLFIHTFKIAFRFAHEHANADLHKVNIEPKDRYLNFETKAIHLADLVMHRLKKRDRNKTDDLFLKSLIQKQGSERVNFALCHIEARKALYEKYLKFGGPSVELNNPIEETAAAVIENIETLKTKDVANSAYLRAFIITMVDSIRLELIIGQTNLILLDHDTISQVINANQQGLINCNDMKHMPFDKLIIEFDKPISFDIPDLKTSSSFNAIAVGIYTHSNKQSYTIIYFSEQSMNGSNQAESQTISIHMCYKDNQELVYGSFLEMATQQRIGAPSQKILAITRNIWDFITCRNIDYEPNPRPQIKTNERRYKHLQGKEAALLRDYRLIKVNRRITPYSGTGNGQELAFKIHIPGTFRKLVYCKTCGDLHRHDLIGQPCRKCNTKVGPFSNIEIHKFWISNHWKGPENAPEQQLARHLK